MYIDMRMKPENGAWTDFKCSKSEFNLMQELISNVLHQVMSMMICQGKLLQIPPKNLGSQEQRDLFRSQ